MSKQQPPRSSVTPQASPSPSSPQNNTYQRALSAFFQGEAPSDEQRSRLPDEVDGLSVRRKAMIQAVEQASSPQARHRALLKLHRAFGLPSQVSILAYALTPEDPPLTLAALKRLEPLLREHITHDEPLSEAQRELLRERLTSLEVRLFQEEHLTLTSACLKLLRS